MTQQHGPLDRHFDLAIIGAGSGNMIVNRQFADWRVAIVEEGQFGGTCLNVGCIPTKMFVHPADIVREALAGPDLGVLTSYDGVRWPQLRERIFARVRQEEERGRAYRQGLANVEVFEDHATFVDDHTLRLQGDDGPSRTITADQVVIAAGSRVSLAPVPGLDEVDFHTSDTVMHLEELPRRMTIVGGGYVAAEFAHIFSAFGTEVTQVQRGPQLLQRLDEDIAERFTQQAGAQWTVRLNTQPTKVVQEGRLIRVHLDDGGDLETDVLLMATGRVANADRLSLENTGVEVEDGIVKVDQHQRTSVPGIWALGDVANHWQLKHVANAEARTIKHNLLNPEDLVATDHRFVPSAVFTSPQIATVGLTSQQARAQGVDHRVAVQEYADVAYGWAMEPVPGAQSKNVVKLLADAEAECVLGAHVIGPQASLLIQSLVEGMSRGSTVLEMSRGEYWIHPALTEVVENALLALRRRRR